MRFIRCVTYLRDYEVLPKSLAAWVLDIRRNYIIMFFNGKNVNLSVVSYDEVAEWLRRWTANPMGSARVGSNPIFVVYTFFMIYCQIDFVFELSSLG